MYRLTLLVVALLVILACGGGGGGGNGGGGGVSISVSPKSTNVAPGGTVNFTGTVTGSSDLRVSWSIISGGGSIASTGTNTATFTAPASGTSTIRARSVADTSKTDDATVTVTTSTGVNVSGRVIDDFSTAGLPGVTVEFLNNSKNVVGALTTNAAGTFSGRVPTTARFIRLPAATFPADYYSQFEYKGSRYSTIIAGCDAPIQTLVAGDNPLGNIRLSPTHQPPPPPPNGCS